MHILSLYSSPPGSLAVVVSNRFSRQEILTAVKAVLAKVLGINETAAMFLHARLKHDLGADSLDMTDIIVEVEKNFHITISDHRAEQLKTIDDLVSCVETLTAGRI